MSKSAEKKYSQASILIFALILGLTSIYGILLFLPKLVLAGGVPVVQGSFWYVNDLPAEAGQAAQSVSDAARFTFLQTLDETTAYFFNTALASVLNDIARQSATWVATGGAGQKP
ncbi:MAG: hypothetical protein NTX82_01765, partial [Candidatus Parcubacteria bacterium]|nr:hypothetical protein [Candidatus Parcubacteria bacterium]